jgi:hypothetical protein
MTKKNTLVKQSSPSPMTALDVQVLIAQAIDKNVPVETMEKLLSMRMQLKAEWAKEQYHEALAAFQAEMPILKKTKIVMNKDGKTERYRYAPLDSIVTQLRSLIEKHGFSYRIEAGIDGRVVNATCAVTHTAGHSESSSFAVPIDPDAYMNEAQKYAAALTFAKRYAFCDSLGVLTGDQDDDAVSISTTAPSMVEKHRRTKKYEEATGAGDPKVEKDHAELATFLADHKIPDGFLLRLLQDKKLIDGRTKTVADLKPGIVLRCLDAKTKENLIKAWAAQQADEDSGSQTPPPPKETPPPKDDERSPFDSGTPTRHSLGEPDPEPPPSTRKTKAPDENGMDQTPRGARTPVVADIEPADILEQEGIDGWRKVKIHFGKQSGTPLGKLPRNSLDWWIENYTPKPYKGTWQEKDLLLDAGLCLASAELSRD